jgi:hypothetical protein
MKASAVLKTDPTLFRLLTLSSTIMNGDFGDARNSPTLFLFSSSFDSFLMREIFNENNYKKE